MRERGEWRPRQEAEKKPKITLPEDFFDIRTEQEKEMREDWIDELDRMDEWKERMAKKANAFLDGIEDPDAWNEAIDLIKDEAPQSHETHDFVVNNLLTEMLRQHKCPERNV